MTAPAVTCPWCGEHYTSFVVSFLRWRFLCSCGSLHNGTDAEHRRLADTRANRRRYLFPTPPEPPDLTATGGVINTPETA